MQSEASILAQLAARFPSLVAIPAWQWHIARNGGFVTDIIDWGPLAVRVWNKDGIKLTITDAGGNGARETLPPLEQR